MRLKPEPTGQTGKKLDSLELEKFAGDEDRRRKDLDLWKTWNDGGQRKEDLRPLLNNFRGAIRTQAHKWSNVEIAPVAVKAEFTKQAINAFKTYDPDKGAPLNYWVNTHLSKAQRWVTSHQNMARISEKRVYNLGAYKSAISTLDDMLGREPTTGELADYLGWSEKEIMRIGTDDRKDLIESAFEGDPVGYMPSRITEALSFVKHDLTPEEQLVYEYTLGSGGKPKLTPGQIATKLGISPSKVTRVRQKIYDKTTRFM